MRPVHRLSSGANARRHVHEDVVLRNAPVRTCAEHEPALSWFLDEVVVGTSWHETFWLELLRVRVDGGVVERLQGPRISF